MDSFAFNLLIPVAGVAPAAFGALLLALIYWARYCYRGASWPKSVIKTGSVLLLALAAWLAGGPGMLILALLLCAAGDYLLSRDDEAQFMAGVGAFAAGHLAYVWLFLAHPKARIEVLFTPPHIFAIAGLAGFGLIMAALLWRRAGEMRVPVMIYIPIILSMGVSVLALPLAGPLSFALPAALLFIASDFSLSLEEFVLPEAHLLRRVLPFVIWPTYWLAQFGFAGAFAMFPMK